MNCYPVSAPNLDQLEKLKAQREEILKNAKEEPRFEPLTLDEKRSIFKAMGHELRGYGHYYKCNKGHTVWESMMKNIRSPDYLDLVHRWSLWVTMYREPLRVRCNYRRRISR